jgi:hypothetical protein
MQAGWQITLCCRGAFSGVRLWLGENYSGGVLMRRTDNTTIEQITSESPETHDPDRPEEALDRARGRGRASGFLRVVSWFFLLGRSKGDFGGFESFRYFRDHHRRF